jgi:hypothetical protein
MVVLEVGKELVIITLPILVVRVVLLLHYQQTPFMLLPELLEEEVLLVMVLYLV